MLVADAQREVRTAFVGGFMGQLVSGALWLTSAALGTWGTPRQAITLLVLGGVFIFPLTQLGLRPGAATLYRLEWFYPAFMIVLGAHYLPFVFLYGMRMFAALSAVLVGGGLWLGTQGPPTFALGAWVTGVVLLGFALLGRALVIRETAWSA